MQLHILSYKCLWCTSLLSLTCIWHAEAIAEAAATLFCATQTAKRGQRRLHFPAEHKRDPPCPQVHHLTSLLKKVRRHACQHASQYGVHARSAWSGWVQRRVLRLREGDPLEVCDGMGTIAEGRFAGITHNNRAFVETTGNVRQVMLTHTGNPDTATAEYRLALAPCLPGYCAPKHEHLAAGLQVASILLLYFAWCACASAAQGDVGMGCAMPVVVVVQVEWQGPKWEVAVACFSLKKDRGDWLVEKCTELGAWGLRPILTTRSPHLGAGTGLSQCSVHSLRCLSLSETHERSSDEHCCGPPWCRAEAAGD